MAPTEWLGRVGNRPDRGVCPRRARALSAKRQDRGRPPSIAMLLNRSGSRLFAASAEHRQGRRWSTRRTKRSSRIVQYPPQLRHGRGEHPERPGARSVGGVSTSPRRTKKRWTSSTHLCGHRGLVAARWERSARRTNPLPVGNNRRMAHCLVDTGDRRARWWGSTARARGAGPNPREDTAGTSRSTKDLRDLLYPRPAQNGNPYDRVRQHARPALSPPSPAGRSGANGWTSGGRRAVPAFEHGVYIIRRNRTYDQVFGDLQAGRRDRSWSSFRAQSRPNTMPFRLRASASTTVFSSRRGEQPGTSGSTGRAT